MLLRIYLGEQEKHGHEPLYQMLVAKARAMGLAGATVLRGPLGFGRSGHVHTAKVLDLSQDLPLVIEMVDSEERLRAFAAAAAPLIADTLVTLERVEVLRFGERPAAAGGGQPNLTSTTS